MDPAQEAAMVANDRAKLLRELGSISVERLRRNGDDLASLDKRQAEILSALGSTLEDALEELQRILVNTVSQ